MCKEFISNKLFDRGRLMQKPPGLAQCNAAIIERRVLLKIERLRLILKILYKLL